MGQDTPCHFDFLTSYFTTRIALQVRMGKKGVCEVNVDDSLQVPELVLNLTALLSTTFLARYIVKVSFAV